MAEPRKPDQAEGEQVREQENAPTTKSETSTGTTMRELERLQFDALERIER